MAMDGYYENHKLMSEILYDLISHPDFWVAVNAELNYTSELIYFLRDIRLRGEALLTELEEEYPSSN